MTGCPSAPKPPFDYRAVNAGKWRAKAEIEDRKKKETHTLTINFKSIKSENKVRADISAVLGIHLASVVIDGNFYQALLMKKKEFREGQIGTPSESKGIFGVPIDLKILPAILYDQSIDSVGWVCHSDGQGLLQDCENSSAKMRLEIMSRDGKDKKVQVIGEGYIMNLNFDSFSPEENFSEKTFNLPVPKGFKRL